MEITAYSVTYEDCGKIDGITSSGEEIYEGVVASDPEIPFGTRLWIEGIGEVVVKDRGGAIHGDLLDLYIPNPEEAKKFGRQKRRVYFL
jgi:3D (Asp-Asp-Asp) domain-containing protein